MKAAYVKPALFIERFSVSQSIALGCTVGDGLGKGNHGDKYTCAWVMPSGKMPWITGTVCNDFYGAEDEFAGLCYNNPDGGMTIFSS